MTTSRWELVRVLELAVYAASIVISFAQIPRVFSARWRETCRNYGCKRFLERGWLGEEVDVADGQWKDLRKSLPLLCMALIAHAVLSLVVRATSPREDKKANHATEHLSTAKAKGDGALASKQAPCLPVGTLGRRRIVLNTAVSIAFLAVVHGAHAVFPVALACAAFAVGHATKGTFLAPTYTWTMAVALIWLKERWYRTFTFKSLEWLGLELDGLDRSSGLYPWRLSLNLAILRIVSFNMDLHWAALGGNRRQSSASQQQEHGDTQEKRVKEHDEDPYEPETRIAAHRPASEYSLWHFLSYVFYAPLYLAGPTITFNSFVSHMACPQRSYGATRLAVYLGRVVFAFLLLEYGLHKMPVFALARSNTLGLGPGELAGLIYVILKLMWLKFLVIWRLFRFWALCDGVEPPENMQRCMSNNYSVSNFWRGWHCSFNRWLVRYVYIPLGGAEPGRRWNVFVVFVFVALWHDVESKLLLWGLLNGVFLLVEIRVKGFYKRSRLFKACRSNVLANRMLQALGATSTVMVLFLVNLIGYTVGIDRTRYLLQSIFIARDGQIAILVSFLVLFSGVQVVIHITLPLVFYAMLVV